jgi:hypothetical protein
MHKKIDGTELSTGTGENNTLRRLVSVDHATPAWMCGAARMDATQ